MRGNNKYALSSMLLTGVACADDYVTGEPTQGSNGSGKDTLIAVLFKQLLIK